MSEFGYRHLLRINTLMNFRYFLFHGETTHRRNHQNYFSNVAIINIVSLEPLLVYSNEKLNCALAHPRIHILLKIDKCLITLHCAGV